MNLKVVLLVFFIFNLALLCLWYQQPSRTAEKVKIEHIKTKHILYWQNKFSSEDFYLGLGEKIFQHCEVRNCMTTNNKKLMPVEKFDAIIFHGHEYTFEKYGKPYKRSPHQYYINANQEPAILMPPDTFENFFNWTMSYRQDSDVIHDYGRFVKNSTGYVLPNSTEIAKKTKKIAWMVSRCISPGERENIVRELQKHIPVDVYGKCGSKKCGSFWDREQCYQMVQEQYKFYLSFENSVCKDYVTEKMYHLLLRNVVPIVYGGADYDKFAPPKSVIDITKFRNVSELGKYLNYLDKNVTEYLSYFEWKKNYSVNVHASRLMLCDLCKKLNNPLEPNKVYKDVHQWYYDGMCKNGSTLPDITLSALKGM